MKKLIIIVLVAATGLLIAMNVSASNNMTDGAIGIPREYPGQQPEWRTCPEGYQYFADVDPETNLITPSCYDESDTTFVMSSTTVCPYELMPIINDGVLECHQLGRTVKASR